MADIPRDPRQLARDILAGRISIEQLAREEQRRAGGVVRPPQQRLPDRVPLPRTLPQQLPKPMVRQAPVIPPRQAPRPPMVKAIPQRGGAPGPVIARAVTPQAAEAPLAPAGPAVPGAAYAGQVKAGTTAVRTLDIMKVARSRAALRQCMFMAEVLGKPVALREEW